MTLEEQQAFAPRLKARITEIRLQLQQGRESREAIAPDKSIGRLSRLDSMQMQQMALAAKRRLENELHNLEEALRRIAAGNYGRCELCGNDIAAERLEYQPDAVCCVRCLEGKR